MTTLLTEMPQLIGDLDFDLNTVSANIKLLHSFKKDSRNTYLFDYNGIAVFKCGRYYYGNLSGRIVYIVKTESKLISSISRIATIQRALWRDQTVVRVGGLAKKMFTDVLLHTDNIVITDCRQTEDGKLFWRLRVGEALANNHRVYFLKATGPRKLVKLTFDNFDQASKDYDFWGWSEKHKAHWLVITKTKLHPKDDVQIL